MRVERVSVGFGYTSNPRPYETLRFDVRLDAAVDEGEDWGEVARELHAAAKAEVRRQVTASTGRAAPDDDHVDTSRATTTQE
ncbi:MAG: hypothetical protein IT302_13130 [Dehalococcoidia bacterium]|nr:hypothetical protein [Dehalococcoidia bacterium]